MSKIDLSLVQHVANLAQIPITKKEALQLQHDFDRTLKVVDQLNQINTDHVEPTSQVTGLENAWREDVVDAFHTFTQKEALQNASRTHQGYFVVPKILEK